jgi:NAD(P)-dependent dehydrogenase (short-subunit alcohol dehydrogenase family)
VGSGIGRATALAFAEKGADIVIVDKEEGRIAEAAEEIRARGARVLTRKVDVSDQAQVEDLAKYVMSERGRVDILHNKWFGKRLSQKGYEAASEVIGRFLM